MRQNDEVHDRYFQFGKLQSMNLNEFRNEIFDRIVHQMISEQENIMFSFKSEQGLNQFRCFFLNI